MGGGFARLSAGGQSQTWSTLDLGKAGGAGEVDSWKNNSHQGIIASASEPTRGLNLKAGDIVSWRLLFRQGLYEMYFAPPRSNQTYYFAAAYAATAATTCSGGKKEPNVNIELRGAFAQSRGVVAYRTTLDLHDYNPAC